MRPGNRHSFCQKLSLTGTNTDLKAEWPIITKIFLQKFCFIRSDYPCSKRPYGRHYQGYRPDNLVNIVGGFMAY